MCIGLYTLYGGILLTYDSIPAGCSWIYYTNPGRSGLTCDSFGCRTQPIACFSKTANKRWA